VTEPIRFGSETISREELTAEMGAAFLCAMAGIDVQALENQAAYQRLGGSGTSGTGARPT